MSDPINDPISPKEKAEQLRKQADQIEAEVRVAEAVRAYGKELKPGISIAEAFNTIADCLELGAKTKYTNELTEVIEAASSNVGSASIVRE